MGGFKAQGRSWGGIEGAGLGDLELTEGHRGRLHTVIGSLEGPMRSGRWGKKLDDVNSKIILKTKSRSALEHREVDARGPHSLQRWRQNHAALARVAGPSVGANSLARPPGARDLRPIGSWAPAPPVSTSCRAHAHDSSYFRRSWAPAKSGPVPASSTEPSLPEFAPVVPPLSSGTLGGTNTTSFHSPPAWYL